MMNKNTKHFTMQGHAGLMEGLIDLPLDGKKPRGIALVAHPHPLYGGTMENKVTQTLARTFVTLGYATARFNFRGVGKSQGVFDNGVGELSDAASALDWVQQIHPEAEVTWIAGFSFGAWIGMQLLMRRPEARGFISIAPPANMYDFSFLAPCPASGIIIQGEADSLFPLSEGDANARAIAATGSPAMTRTRGGNFCTSCDDTPRPMPSANTPAAAR